MKTPTEKQSATVTKLPDGSAFFTADIMSNEEALALPQKERPLNYRISGDLYHAVFETVGAASMCWNPNPSDQVFESEKAANLAVDMCFKIADEMDSLREALEKIYFYAATGALQESLDEIKRIAGASLLTKGGGGSCYERE